MTRLFFRNYAKEEAARVQENNANNQLIQRWFNTRKVGQATLNGANPAIIAVADSTVTNKSVVLVTRIGGGLAVVEYFVTLVPSQGFTIHSTLANDTSLVGYVKQESD